MSMKSNQRNDSKRRTATVNEVGDSNNGSTLELISYQMDTSSSAYDNVNRGYCEGNVAHCLF